MADEREKCPLCGRPESQNYGVEEEACQFFRHLRARNSLVGKNTDMLVVDCIKRAIPRVRGLEAEIVDLKAIAKTARGALARHHDAQHPATFRNGARIE